MYIVAHVIEEGRGCIPDDRHEYINADYIEKIVPVDIHIKEHDMHVYYVCIHMHAGDVYKIKRDSYLDAIEFINNLLDARVAGTEFMKLPDDVKFRLCSRYPV